jgi:hypothetical protein
MIDIYREVVEIFDEKIENATKYNGRIYELTELDQLKDNITNIGGHGDIIKYLEENKLDTEQLQEVLLAFVKALRGHI